MRPEALVDDGNALYRSGDIPGAMDRYRAAIAADPGYARAHYNLGVLLQGLQRPGEAIVHYERVSEASPEFPKALLNWGNALKDGADLGGAAQLYCRAFDADRAAAQALRNVTLMADIARKGGDPELARALYAMAAERGSADGYAGLGTIAGERREHQSALESFAAALAIDARHVPARHNLGVALQRLHRYAEAIVQFEQVVRLDPSHVAARVNWGEALRRSGDGDAAREQFDQVLRLDPGNAMALNNLATTAMDCGDLDAAAGIFEKLAGEDSGYEQPRFNLAIIALHRQRFAEGWDLYERRFEAIKSGLPAPLPGIPAFDPREGAPASIAILKEQGIGDQVLFSTVLPELTARGIHGVVEVDRRLAQAYSRSVPGFEFLPPPEARAALARCDAQLPLGSLPRHFRRTRESFARQPGALLAADRARVAALVPALAGTRNIAVSWRSFQRGTRPNVEGRKSIPLECFAALGLRGVRLVDVQYGDVDEERAAFDERHPGLRTGIGGLDAFDDLEGVMAALEACDLVVTASNVTAHLAGAIGKRTWLVYLGANPVFHYWVPGPGGRSLWYPSVEIVTDRAWSDWEQAFAAVGRRLEEEA